MMNKISAIALASIMTISVFAATAYANPPGARDGVGKMIGKWNVIIVPQEWSEDDTTCGNEGARMFFNEPTSGNTIGAINFFYDPSVNNLDITDCDGTTDNLTEVHSPDSGKTGVFARLHGPVTSEVKVLCAEINDINDDETLCLLDEFNLNRKAFTKLSQNLINDGLEGVTFTLQTINGKPVKIIEFRVYELVP